MRTKFINYFQFYSTKIKWGGVLTLLVFLFSTCKLFQNPLEPFLEYYTSLIQITDFEIPSTTRSQKDSKGIYNISTEEDAKIKIKLVNPQSYPDLTGTVVFDNPELDNLEKRENVTLKQDEQDKSLFILTFPKDFLIEAEKDSTTNNISATLQVSNSHKQSNEYKINLIANAPPKQVQNLQIMQTTGDASKFILRFDMPNLNDSTSLRDTNRIRLNAQGVSGSDTDKFPRVIKFDPNYTSRADMFDKVPNSVSITKPDNIQNPTAALDQIPYEDTDFSIYIDTDLSATAGASNYRFTVELIDECQLTSINEVSLETPKLGVPTVHIEDIIITQNNGDSIASEDDFLGTVRVDELIKKSSLLSPEDTTIICNVQNIQTGKNTLYEKTINDSLTLYPGLNEISFILKRTGYLDSNETTSLANVYVEPKKLMVASSNTGNQLGTKEHPFTSVSEATAFCSDKEKVRYNEGTIPTIYIDNSSGNVTINETDGTKIGNEESNDNPENFNGINIEPINTSNTATIKKPISSSASLFTARYSLTISNITLDGQKDESDNQFAQQGGAININSGASVTTNNCIIKNFKAIHFGGGICNAGTYTDNGSTIKNCQSKAGGGIYTNGITTLNGTQIIENIATVTGTDTSNADGGGLFGENPSGGTYKITATDCIIKDNKVINSSTGDTGNAHGGGVHLKATSQNNSFTNCNFINNSVSYNYDSTYNSNALGGGLSVMSGNNTNTFTNCNFAENVTTNNADKFDGYGGAIYISDRNSTNDNPQNIFNNCTIGSCTIDGTKYGPNKAKNGGGVYTKDNVTFNNCIIGNKAKEDKDYTVKEQVVGSDNEQGYLANEDSAGNIALFGAALFCTWDSSKCTDGINNPIVELNNTKVCFNYVVYQNPTDNKFAYTGTAYDNESTCVIIMQGSPIVKLNNETQIFGNKNGYLFRMDHGSRLDILGNSKIHHNYASKKSVIWLNQNAQLWLSDGTIEYNNMEKNGGACINAYPENYYGTDQSPTVNICGGTIKNNYRVDNAEGCYEIKIVKYTSGNDTRCGTLNFGTYDKDNSCGKIQIGNYSSTTPSSLNKYDSIYIYDGCSVVVSYLSMPISQKIARFWVENPSSSKKIIRNDFGTSSLNNIFDIVNWSDGLKTDSSGKLK